MHRLNIPRYMSAGTDLPGDEAFWNYALAQSDIFSYDTVSAGRGGPFGAQLWLLSPDGGEYVLAGTEEEMFSCNAVLEKGIASAHAEAESLSPERRAQVSDFLRERRGRGWKVVQVSSGESCPSCRAKQVLFAGELVQKGLLEKGDFFVIFRSTYERAEEDADFNDYVYDRSFRTIMYSGLLDDEAGLFAVEGRFTSDQAISEYVRSGSIVFNPVSYAKEEDVSEQVLSFMRGAGETPAAAIVARGGTITGAALDTRSPDTDGINLPENTAIISALNKAAASLRAGGTYDSWDMDGATLYTNISEIGPLAYSESLWSNLSGIKVVGDLACEAVNRRAQELPGTGNRELFRQVATDYDDPATPLRVVYKGNPQEPNVAHLLWKARMAREKLDNDQARILDGLAEKNGRQLTTKLIAGGEAELTARRHAAGAGSHYNGKRHKGED